MAELARSVSSRGEMVLSRSHNGSIELRVNGVFVMDSHETGTERLLASLTMAALPVGEAVVVIGGLGLGYTLREVLAHPVRHVIVAEIERDLVAWHRDGVIPSDHGAAGLLSDPRVRVEVGDVRTVVADLPPASVDAILLDVDNGPGYLVYDENAEVYHEPFLTVCSTALTAGGVLGVWSADSSPELVTAMWTAFGRVEEHDVPVVLGRRTTSYLLYIGHRLP